MKKLTIKLLSIFSFFGLAFSTLVGLSNRSIQASATSDNNCLGTVSITKAQMNSPYGNESDNCFLGLWLSGSDYPNYDGNPAVQCNNAFENIGATDNYSHIKLNGETCSQTHNDMYINMWTYHPVFTFCLLNSRSITDPSKPGTIEIDTEFRIPSYASVTNPNDHTYYVLDRNVTLSRPSTPLNLVNNAWSDNLVITASAISKGDAQIEENFAYFDLAPESNTFVTIFNTRGTDYLNGYPNQPFGGIAKDDYKTGVIINGKTAQSYGCSEALISKWTSPVKNMFGFEFPCPNGFSRSTCVDVEVLKGTRIPSSNSVDYYVIDGHYVGVIDLIGLTNCNDVDNWITNFLNNESVSYQDLKDNFNNISSVQRQIFFEATNAYGDSANKLTALVASQGEQISSYSIDGNVELGEARLIGLRSYNAFGNPNEFLWIQLDASTVDYPTGDGDDSHPVQFNESQVNYAKNCLKHIELYDGEHNIIATDVFEGYINMFTYHSYFDIGLLNLGNAKSIVLKKGMIIPSYSFITNDQESDTYGHYVLDKDYELYIQANDSHSEGDFNEWALPIVTIKYLNDVGNPMDSYPDETVDCGSVVTLRGAPEKEGYSSSWTVVEPADGYTLEGLSLTVPSSPCTLIVQATYVGRSYTLGFEGINTTLSVTFGEAIDFDLPDVPNKAGYSNGRWVIDEKVITKGYIWDFASDKTATAEYDLDSYTVTFNSNGGTSVETVNVIHGEKVAKPADPTKEGFSFAGWYLDETLTQVYDFESPVVSNLTLYAKWNESCIVIFNTDGGSLIDSVVVAKGSTVTRPSFDPTKEGYTFVGWYLGNTEYDFNTPVTTNITLTAHYTKNGGEKKNGCGGSIAATAIITSLVSVIGISLLLLKKKETD